MGHCTHWAIWQGGVHESPPSRPLGSGWAARGPRRVPTAVRASGGGLLARQRWPPPAVGSAAGGEVGGWEGDFPTRRLALRRPIGDADRDTRVHEVAAQLLAPLLGEQRSVVDRHVRLDVRPLGRPRRLVIRVQPRRDLLWPHRLSVGWRRRKVRRDEMRVGVRGEDGDGRYGRRGGGGENEAGGVRQRLPVGTARRGTNDVHVHGAERVDQLRLQLRMSPPVRRQHDLCLRRLCHALQGREREREGVNHRTTGTAETSVSRGPAGEHVGAASTLSAVILLGRSHSPRGLG